MSHVHLSCLASLTDDDVLQFCSSLSRFCNGVLIENEAEWTTLELKEIFFWASTREANPRVCLMGDSKEAIRATNVRILVDGTIKLNLGKNNLRAGKVQKVYFVRMPHYR